jgi:hypothetical protein
MKRDFSKNGHRENIDKVDKKATVSGAVKKEKSSKRRLSIYDDFDDEEMDDFDMKAFKSSKFKR